MKQNLFDYSTVELTNDAIICWMLDWANSENKTFKTIEELDNMIYLSDAKLEILIAKLN